MEEKNYDTVNEYLEKIATPSESVSDNKGRAGRYVITDKGYCIDTEMFGFDTAGSLSQHNLKIDGKKVYETFWSYGGEYENDYNDEEFLGNIIFETDTKIEILDKENYGQEIR